MRKIGFSFHESLKLRRTNLAQVLECFADGISDFDTIHKRTSLGTNEAKSAPGYLRGAGLVDEEKGLTQFGKLALTYDPTLTQVSTQWLMHYHFSAPQGDAPAYWEMLVRNHFLQEVLDTDKLAKVVADFVVNTEGREINVNTVRSSVNIVLKSYVEPDGLGGLNILREGESSQYVAGIPVEIPWRVFAYILADFWEANWGTTLSIPYAALSNDAGPGALLLLNSGQIGQLLRPMQEAGLIEVTRVTRPWTVLRNWQNKEALLEAVYTHDNDS